MAESRRLIGILPTAWTASVWKRMPRSRAMRAISSTGKMTPVSLLAHMALTITVSSVRLSRNRCTSRVPSLCTCSRVV